MQNNTNNTPAPATSNPQDPAAYPGASNGADFQSTATREALTGQSNQELTVQETGQPIAGNGTAAAGGLPELWLWIGGFVVIVIIIVVVVRKLINEPLDEMADRPAAAPARKPTTAKKTAAKSAGQRTASAKKKTAPPYRRKKKATRKR